MLQNTATSFAVIYLSFLALSLQGCSRKESNNSVSTIASKKARNADFTFDFGVVRTGDNIKKTFELSNHTEQACTISRIISGCACASVKPSSKQIPAGGVIELEIEFRPGNVSRDASSELLISFKGTNTPAIRAKVIARVRDEVVVIPETIDIQCGLRERFAETALVVENYGMHDWSYLHASSGNEGLECKLIKVDSSFNVAGPRQRWEGKVGIDLEHVEGMRFEGAVELSYGTADLDEVKSKKIAVKLTREPAVRVIPGQLMFGTVKNGERVKKSLWLRFSNYLSAQERDDVAISIPPELKDVVHVSLKSRRADDHEYEVTLEHNAHARNTDVCEGTLLIVSESSSFDNIVVPLYCNISTNKER